MTAIYKTRCLSRVVCIILPVIVIATNGRLDSRLRFVAHEDIAITEGAGFGDLQVQFLFDAVEHGGAIAQGEWMNYDLVFVNQTCRGQLRDDAAAAHDHERVTGLLLEFARGRYDVALD